MQSLKRVLSMSLLISMTIPGCMPMKESRINAGALDGIWEYVDCAIKNTSVKGLLVFEGNRFIFDGRVRQDYPTRPFRREYEFRLEGAGQIGYASAAEKESPPVLSYFLIDGDYLYFSEYAMASVLDDRSGPYRQTNWQYKLKRI
jgi:hypothetical protein